MMAENDIEKKLAAPLADFNAAVEAIDDDEAFVDLELDIKPSTYEEKVDRLIYWGSILRRDGKVEKGNDLALTRGSALVLDLGMVNLHNEWLYSDEDGQPRKINIDRIAGCYTAYSPLVGLDVLDLADGAQRIDYTGKRVCGNKTLCAHCDGVEAQRDEKKADLAIKYAEAQGYDVVLTTFTAPHTDKTDDLWFVKAMNKAHRAALKDKKYRRFIQKYGIIDLEVGNEEKGLKAIPHLRGLECMLAGQNGSHYHFHETDFIDVGDEDREAVAAKMRALLRELWEKYAVKYGLVPAEELDPVGFAKFHEKCFKLDLAKTKEDKKKAAEYVSKLTGWKSSVYSWSLASEMTRSGRKKSKGDGLTYFELVAKIMMFDAPKYRRARGKSKEKAKAVLDRDVAICCKYAGATWHRQKFDVSPGLQSWIDAADDHADEVKERETLAGFDPMQWAFVLDYGLTKHIKAAVLAGGGEGVARLSEWFNTHGLGHLHSALEVMELREAEERKREVKAAERAMRSGAAERRELVEELLAIAEAKKKAEEELEKDRAVTDLFYNIENKPRAAGG